MAQMNSTTTGTGTLQLNAAMPGFQTFAAAGAANTLVYSYGIADSGSTFEVGKGTYITNTTGQFLQRTTINYSSNAGGPINCSGFQVVYLTMLQQDYDTFTPANSISIGANVTMNSTVIFVGNSTANGVSNSTVDVLANASGQTVSTPVSLTVQNSSVNTIIGQGTITRGNTVANTFANSISIDTANSTAQTTIQPGIVRLSGAGSNAGLIVGTASKLANSTAVFGANGYTFLPNGLLLQWIANTVTTTGAQKAWPVAFPTACVAAFITLQATTGSNVDWTAVISSNTSGANIISGGTAVNCYVMGIGF
jgi:hypothetical protein